MRRPTLSVPHFPPFTHSRENISVRLTSHHLHLPAKLVLLLSQAELERGVLGGEGGGLPELEYEVIHTVTVGQLPSVPSNSKAWLITSQDNLILRSPYSSWSSLVC